MSIAAPVTGEAVLDDDAWVKIRGEGVIDLLT